MIYFKFKEDKKNQFIVKKENIFFKIFEKILTSFIPISNPDFSDKINDVLEWYIEYDDIENIVENGRPSWFPYQIFSIVNNELPANWFVKINIGNDYVDYRNLFGFDELCNKEDFFNQLLERDEEAMKI